MSTFDLTIIGASFAGCAAAIRAAQLGLRVQLVDKKPDVGAKLHTTGIIVRDAVDANPFLQHIPTHLTRRIEHIRLFSPSLKELVLRSPGYYFLATDTPNLMRWMVQSAMDAGVTLQLGTTFTTARNTAQGLALDGLGETRFLIGADGPHSRVAKAFGLGQNTRFLYGVEHELAHTAVPDANALYCFISKRHARGYIGWGLQGTNTVQLGTALRYGAGHSGAAGLPVPDLSAFERHIAPVLPLDGAQRVATRAGFIPCGGLVAPLGAARVLLAGDAAGLVSPVTAGGIHTAWKHGWAMGEAVALHLRNQGAHPTLVAAQQYPRFTVKRLLRFGFDHFQTDWMFDALLHTRSMRAAAAHIYFHKR